ncbi:hypothetical protein BDF20DRAFT_111541 [Mycotypha africana]|uniref:uncharacterized protein n=1 Tax=Mycotypha africana TaxID=64632 RepID=UPI0023009E5B|nr:uncharacterized protein BDF20DRAFT_111541 [Mycotypha africana]KAI8970201.1 hypothetical protein BDF20DRAFT_111541 [Mycotypha africana]
MRLRIKHAEGTSTLTDIDSSDTFLKLKDQIKKTIGLNMVQEIQISGGYPPKAINGSENDSLFNIGIRDGDSLNVKVTGTTVTNQKDQTQPLPSNGIIASSNKIISNNAIKADDGYLILRVMEDDNSCLFRAMVIQKTYVLQKDPKIAAELRQVVASAILSDPITYNDVTLGQPREKYMEWIQRKNSWGGAIELAIFSNYFQVEIDSIDVQTGRIDKFGEGLYSERVLIVYNGIHYDALALAPDLNLDIGYDQTQFPTTNNNILLTAQELVSHFKAMHLFTDIANFSIRCEQCKIGLRGEKDAQEHATRTGHTSFVEYNTNK